MVVGMLRKEYICCYQERKGLDFFSVSPNRGQGECSRHCFLTKILFRAAICPRKRPEMPASLAALCSHGTRPSRWVVSASLLGGASMRNSLGSAGLRQCLPLFPPPGRQMQPQRSSSQLWPQDREPPAEEGGRSGRQSSLVPFMSCTSPGLPTTHLLAMRGKQPLVV